MKRLHHQLRITEIFYSLQGESTTTGLPTVFIRLTGCPLRCQYCDTAYAFSGGILQDIEDVLNHVASFDCLYVCVTGGEPLAQPGCLELLKQLCDSGYRVSLETSGARDISKVDKRVMIVMDLKTPDSKEHEKNQMSNLDYLKPDDQIKFVLCSRADYEWACTLIKTFKLNERAHLLFSPSWNQLNATSLAEWIIEDHLPVRFQIQIHKILWNDAPGH
ncbi:7-carboxy-7-deazaguanine synthase QueE [Legionella israelensis]|uniref:7-carboxy-7-deazaguanine synthase n=1 Tax=Legionella israelensis TaxID=454 RepID=A0A0W0WNG6_9GAMM|nr:7-carboxy-7-deazaguanine synthase QueE [Legionella israelensis]KTD33861.1 radical activating enzyme [Legionella israelensis]QBR83588.1 7-carboxy-7-deazaguanine synthase QueE [Legionella israelensis]QBS08971.1 7-carboxy-7-deazaguanine synthase QueE [Legionella israelensis]SCX81364.1 7-carboxy-7-deazaguanine synthase [Legionella israelensis DSM 19235]STX58664.1 Organic radical activating enzyme [Legionella israelensis]